jgi:hypothetical protein
MFILSQKGHAKNYLNDCSCSLRFVIFYPQHKFTSSKENFQRNEQKRKIAVEILFYDISGSTVAGAFVLRRTFEYFLFSFKISIITHSFRGKFSL